MELALDEALTEVVVDRRFGGYALGQLRFLGSAVSAIGEQIPGIARRHQPGAARASATRLVSMVIQRRPHCSAT